LATSYQNIFYNQILKKRLFQTKERLSRSDIEDEIFFKKFDFSAVGITPVNFLDQFRQNTRYSFFFNAGNKKEFFLKILSETQSRESILRQAEDVCSNTFQTLGSQPFTFAGKINWHLDFKSGKTYDAEKFYADISLDLDTGAEVKVPWELSRFHWVWWLGKAYWVSGSTKYREKFIELASHWQAENPFCRGVNWVSPMEVAIRACNMIAGYYFFQDELKAASVWIEYLKTLYQHGRYLESNLEYSRRNGNHLISNAVGLFMIGTFFRNSAEGREWIELGQAVLENELPQQTGVDGVNYEMSISYHRLVLEMCYSAMILGDINRTPFSKNFALLVERMFEYTLYYTKPHGLAPLVGDADNGRLFLFNQDDDFNDHRHAISIATVLYEGGSYKRASGVYGEQALWLLGTEGYERYMKVKPMSAGLKTKAFPATKIFVMRNDNFHLFIDAAELGKHGWGGHGNNDTLSFELFAKGANIICDSGTYCYTSSRRLRNQFRSVRSHNTVSIDNRELAEFTDWFRVDRDLTNPRVISWTTDDFQEVLEVEHSAFERLDNPVNHHREFTYNKKKNTLVVRDVFTGRGEHIATSFFHFDPAISVERASYNKLYASCTEPQLNIEIDVDMMDGQVTVEESQLAKSYGVLEKRKCIHIEKRFFNKGEILTRFIL
jgi:hypothetical protein